MQIAFDSQDCYYLSNVFFRLCKGGMMVSDGSRNIQLDNLSIYKGLCLRILN